MSVPAWIEASFDIVIGIIPVSWIRLGSVFFFFSLWSFSRYNVPQIPQILETPQKIQKSGLWGLHGEKKTKKTRWNSSWRSWKHIELEVLKNTSSRPNHVPCSVYKEKKTNWQEKKTKNIVHFFVYTKTKKYSGIKRWALESTVKIKLWEWTSWKRWKKRG